ncbi:hypothetical protein LIER_40330 [Lithospermum erythrorhizon]|uniref:Reverse transcriptase domain-containing protein n=1 Tax=Lithospermum erythrorhizon TaxID=34254 RepID=A0AAV3QWD4_LITER
MLKSIMPEIINPTQSAFVTGRLISDNVLLAYEMHHVLKRRKGQNNGIFSLKLDMQKAYDRTEWGYLKGILEKLGFPEAFITQIMEYISSMSYSVIINGEEHGFLKPSRRLRQGDPLSPYLLILCTKGLIAQINEAIQFRAI